jgi:lipopolysaccharide/colanic/teichoic acid biosynthesis glycosyltransferase
MIKRALDLLFSAVGLVLSAPFLLACLIAIPLESRGPPLFLQHRVGRGGRPFRIVKLRTMVAAAERQGPRVTAGNDARITRLGGWLRRHKLDELPQLWNVLVGDMSLVGPRPEVPEYVACYPPELRETVLSIRPGITDPASVQYHDEAAVLGNYPDPERAYREIILPGKLAIYADYVRTRSMAGDLRIIATTLAVLVGRRQSRTMH